MKTLALTNSDQVSQVSDDDYEDASRFSWSLDPEGYVYRDLPRNGGKKNRQFLHQFLLGVKPGFEIDHKDGNPLNNQRENLRHATHAQNCGNSKKRTETSSRFKGVHWNKAAGKWCVQISITGRRVSLGYFVIEEDAARAYDTAALKHFGEFARLNFPQR